MRRPAAALAHFERAVALDANSVCAQFALSNALRALGRAGEAREHYAIARRLRPDLPPLDP